MLLIQKIDKLKQTIEFVGRSDIGHSILVEIFYEINSGYMKPVYIDNYLYVKSFDFNTRRDDVVIVCTPRKLPEGQVFWKSVESSNYQPALLNRNYRLDLLVDENGWRFELISKQGISENR